MEDQRTDALRALAHPLRLRILSLLTGTAMSAAEVARELEVTHANASYHLRRLADAGELVVDGEERIRGGVAKRYRYPHEDESARRHGSGGDEDRLGYLRATSVELERRVLQREGPMVSTDLEGWVDPQAWERARALLHEASMLLHDANRRPGTEGTVHVSFTAWAFGMQGRS